MQTTSFRMSDMAVRISVVTLLGLTPLYAANYDFDNGGGTGDWNLNTNWNPDGLPSTTDNVFVNVTGAAVKTITLAATPVNSIINEVGLARTGDGTATVNHTGGTLTVQNWFNLGQGVAAAGNNGTGIWNMSGSSVLNVTHSAGGQTVIGVGFTSSPDFNTGILTLSDNAQFLQTAAEVRIGGELATSRAHGTVTLNNNSVLNHTGGGQFRVGVGANGSTGTLNILDSASLTTAGAFIVAPNTGSGATVLQDGTSTVTVNGGWATVGGYGAGTYVMNGGTLGFTGAFGLNVGDNPGGVGTMTVNAGQVNVNGVTNPDLFVGKSSATGTLTVNNSAQIVVNRNLYVGYSGTSSGTLNINDNASVTASTLMVWDAAGTINVNGGSLTATGWITLGQYAGTAVINHNAGDLTTPQVWTTFNSSGTYNLNGGTLSTALFTKGVGTSVFNFNGGTLKASGAFTLGGGNVTTAQVRDGGAVIDSNGLNVTISQDLIHSGIGGDNATDGGLTKNGAGTLTLSGANSYNGTTIVAQGTLLVTGSTDAGGLIHVSPLATLAGSGSVGNVTVDGGAVLSPGAPASNHFSMQDLTLGNTSVLAFELDAPSAGVSLDNDYLMVSGNLILDGVLQVSKRTVPGFGTPVPGDKWLLMNVGGSITDQALTVDPSAPALSPGLAYAIETDTSVPGFSAVYLAVVPEPGTAGLMILAALLLRRRIQA
jgi:fibronectin-binding autotransporter adhesin